MAYRHIWEGGLPEPFVYKKVERDRYYASYVQSYIERDVKDFYNVEKPLQFFDFIRRSRYGLIPRSSAAAVDSMV